MSLNVSGNEGEFDLVGWDYASDPEVMLDYNSYISWTALWNLQNLSGDIYYRGRGLGMPGLMLLP